MAKGRWGHKAVYVPSSQSVYIVGGQVSGRSGSGSGSSGLEITNEVLMLNLTQTDPTAQTLISSSLLPTAFHSLTYSAQSDRIISFGGMTSSCSSDSIIHSLNLGSNSTTPNELIWEREKTEGLLRRRGAGMVYLDSTVGDVQGGKMMVFGGLVDEYVCSSTTSYYSGFDVLPYPSTSTSTPSTDAMGGSLAGPSTHSNIGVTDFAMTALPNSTVLFLGGTDSTGKMVKLDHLTSWSSERDWTRVGLLGEVPVARVGATLVSHPMLKDLVVLHGGAIADGSPSASIAFLNLTTLTWSAPAHVQPARQDARAWHSDIMTPSGVLVSAYGLGAGNMPLSLVSYLDLRDSNSANWGWRRVWTEEMLDSTTSSGSTSSIPSTTNNNSSVGTSVNNDDDDDAGLLKKILPATLIGIILLSLLVWFGRRQVKVVRRRRMARHFEIENTHDEEGNQRRGSFFPANPLALFMEKRGWNRSSSSFTSGTDANGQLPKPFGGVRIPDGDDGDEVETREATGWQSRLTGLVGKFTGRGNMQTPSNSEGSMRQVAGQGVTRTQWEEIDFGLGRIDEQRRGSSALSRPATPGRGSDDRARQMSLHDFNKNRSRVSMSPTSELIDPKGSAPFLVVVPPTVPSTPADLPGQQEDPFASYPVLSPSPRILDNIAEQSNSGANAEWDQLEREVETTQPFKRSGTVSSTRSSGSTESAPESLPRMSFEEQQASSGFSHSLSSYGIGLGQPGAGRTVSQQFNGRSVSTPTPETPTRAPVSAATIGYSPGYVRDLISGHAQSPARVSGGDLSRSATMMDRPLSGGVNLFTKYDGPADQSSRLSLADYRMDAPAANVQRLSNPPRFPPPTSPLPQAPLQFVSRRVSTSDAIDRTPDTTGTLVRSVGESRQLRIANATPDMPAVNEFGARS